MSTMSNFKPCPFCGFIVMINDDEDQNGNRNNLNGMVRCADPDMECPASAMWVERDVWNTRPIEDKKAEEIARLQEINGIYMKQRNNALVAIKNKNTEIERLKDEKEKLDCIIADVMAARKQKFIGVTGGGNPMFWYELHDVEEALAGLGKNSKRQQALKGETE